MIRGLIFLAIFLSLPGCGKDAPDVPIRVFAGLPDHFDIGDQLMKNRLNDSKQDDYIILGSTPNFEYGLLLARSDISPRSHSNQDLMLYVHGGSARMHVADKSYTASTGDIVYIPRGSVYTASALGNRELQYLAIFSPDFKKGDLVYH